MQQCNLEKSLGKFGKEGEEVSEEEAQQPHAMKHFAPVAVKESEKRKEKEFRRSLN